MDELRDQFLIESRDLLAQAAEHFLALDRNPQTTAAIDGAFRAIHTLKGSVALFAMRPAERVLHGAEDLMERARKGAAALDPATIKALVNCLDQIDRWVDEFERDDALPDQAGAIADACLASLAPADFVPQGGSVGGSVGVAADGAWVDALRVREAARLLHADRPLVAFRYRPDADCFFRGDDPLATVQAVPDLLDLAILPTDGQWPEPDAIEPFACFVMLEGLSAAALDDVRAVFRMMPDQVAFAVLDVPREPEAGSPIVSETPAVRSFRVDPARIDALGDGLRELAVAMHGLGALVEQAERIDRPLAARVRACQADLERVAGNLQLGLGAVRAIPLEQGLRRLPRLVREIAETLGKSVDFTIEGQDLEADRQVVDGLFEPLLHLVRNAIDHGIESQDRRRAVGKSPIGKITLRFSRERDAIVAELADDGMGIDPAVLRRAACARNLLTTEAAEALSDADALRLIFLPGFSTARALTELSGRGVGMDAVQAAVAGLRGTIEIDSTPGVGTRFRMALPANTLTTQLLVVEAGGERYGIALDQIIETAGLDKVRVMPVGGGMACVLKARTVPVLELAALLGAGGSPTRNGSMSDGKLIVVRSAGERVGLRVDAFCERIDTLVRPASGMLARIPGVIGSALLSDGAVLLVLDLPELAA
jgi:two-component system chemotaxis sensor kinase CheA